MGPALSEAHARVNVTETPGTFDPPTRRVCPFWARDHPPPPNSTQQEPMGGGGLSRESISTSSLLVGG
jgi:hypothetical protein